MRRFSFLRDAFEGTDPFSVTDFDCQPLPSASAMGRALVCDYRKILTRTEKDGWSLVPLAPRKKLEKRKGPIRTTKATGLADDFYSNLIDWSGNQVSFALDDRVFVQNFLTGKTTMLHKLNNTPITSIKFCRTSSLLAVGTCTGELCLIDVHEGKMFGRRHQHKSRIGVLSWRGNCLLSGSRDRTIKQMDINLPADQRVISLHSQEICGIAYDSAGARLATGGNDNKVFIFDDRTYDKALHTILAHKAAVKAIDWNPERAGVLVTGGGTADRTIKIWNVTGESPEMAESIDYGSQICNVKWTRRDELITTHGYSQNDVRILDLGRKNAVKVFEGHKNRVIHFGISDDEEYFATGSGDETLCIWKVRESDLGQFMVR